VNAQQRRGDVAPPVLGLKAGDWVRIRGVDEILATLDERGRLDEMPFMPQMLQYCGQTLRVRKRAHKMCDTAYSTGARSMGGAVFLQDLRCDGLTYGGCEMACTLVWKEAWLQRAELPRDEVPAVQGEPPGLGAAADLERAHDLLRAHTRRSPDDHGTAEAVYVCQGTQMIYATKPLGRWSPEQYIEDYRSGNASLSQILAGLLYAVYTTLADSGLGFGSAMRWAYDAFQSLRGGTPYPARPGRLPKNSRTPSGNLNLQVGELVRVRDHQAILGTVDERLVNRGMGFHPEMVPYCGKTFRVEKRVRKLINERTGKLVELKNPCLVLTGADCIGRYTKPLNCPRASNPYWREVWLERVEPGPQ
jgi:hypothetical protein